jgi:hypothetical protein
MDREFSSESQTAERLAPRRPMALKRVGRAALKAADKVLARYGLGESALVEQWHEIAGERWAGLTLPHHLNRRSETLTLRVAGPAALELMHQEMQLVDRINTFCGRRLVKRLKIVQGPIAWRPLKQPKTRPLSALEESRIAERVSPIRDDRLREALASLGRAFQARRP